MNDRTTVLVSALGSDIRWDGDTPVIPLDYATISAGGDAIDCRRNAGELILPWFAQSLYWLSPEAVREWDDPDVAMITDVDPGSARGFFLTDPVMTFRIGGFITPGQDYEVTLQGSGVEIGFEVYGCKAVTADWRDTDTDGLAYIYGCQALYRPSERACQLKYYLDTRWDGSYQSMMDIDGINGRTYSDDPKTKGRGRHRPSNASGHA